MPDNEKELKFCLLAFERIFNETQTMISYLNGTFDELEAEQRERLLNFRVLQFPGNDGTDADGSAANVASQPNNPALFSKPKREPKTKEKTMPKIKNISFYVRKNGYYHAVVCFKGVRKDLVGKNKAELVQRAKDMLEELGGYVGLPRNFNEFARLWLETVKQPFISAAYYESLISRFNAHVAPQFVNKRLKQITPLDLQKYFNALCMVSTRVAEDVKVMLSQIFEYAVGNGLIKTNPMRAVQVIRHERENGKALSREDLEYFKAHVADAGHYKIPMLVTLYTGIRPSEVPTVQLDRERGVISVLNSMKKRYQKKTRREIPIVPPLRPYIDEIAVYDFAALKSLNFWRTHFKNLLPNYDPKDLRHTFQTYARLTCTKEMVNLWTGHSLGKDMTDKVYNHIPFEEQKRQAETVIF